MLCNNIKNLIIILCFFITYSCVAPEITDNEFVQPKKQSKRISVATHKDNNIKVCSDAFESSFSLVEGSGRFQKKLKCAANKILKEDTRVFQEQAQEKLAYINDLLQQMEDLQARCEKCIVTIIS